MYYIVICVLINLILCDSVYSLHKFNLRFKEKEQEIFLLANTTDWDWEICVFNDVQERKGNNSHNNCEARCENNVAVYDASCKIDKQGDYFFISVKNIKGNITSKWNCSITTKYNEDNRIKNNIYFQVFLLRGKEATAYFILYGLLALAVVTIFGQCIWISCLRSKAKKGNPPINVEWKRDETSDVEIARYIKMPTQSNSKNSRGVERESNLYEAVDFKKGKEQQQNKSKQAKEETPRPPSLSTLPRSKSTTTLASGKLTEFVDNDWQNSAPTSLDKMRRENIIKRKYRTSAEIMKRRPPLPLPNSDEVYTDKKFFTPPKQFEIPNQDFTAFAPPKSRVKPHAQLERGCIILRPVPPRPSPKPSRTTKRVPQVQIAQAPKQPLVVAQIKQALEQKNLALGSPSSPNFRLPPLPSSGESSFLGGRPAEVHNQMRPPRPKPAPPSKPKQLHPLPPPPVKPTHIPVHTVYSDDSDEEEWTYEPLTNF